MAHLKSMFTWLHDYWICPCVCLSFTRRGRSSKWADFAVIASPRDPLGRSLIYAWEWRRKHIFRMYSLVWNILSLSLPLSVCLSQTCKDAREEFYTSISHPELVNLLLSLLTPEDFHGERDDADLCRSPWRRL